MVTKFERSGILFKPQVFDSFIVSNNGTDEEIVIQDLPQERVEEAAKFMLEYYVKEETFQKATKVSPEALMDFYRFVLRKKVSLACFKKNSGELIGLNALSVKSKGVDTNFKVTLTYNSADSHKFSFRVTTRLSLQCDRLSPTSTTFSTSSITIMSIIFSMLMVLQ
jgi:hypothetical protein